MKFVRFLFAVLMGALLLFYPRPVNAAENQFINVVNPVRISRYTKDPGESVSAQHTAVQESGLPATWLLTYDALVHSGVFRVTQSMGENQELGLWLEITPGFAEAAGVAYNDTDFWHHATSVFLSGYNQEERILLIDTLFAEFYERFGYYPTSVGSWWTDAFSLSYMAEKYGVTVNLGVADQFSTDGYQVWGQYWGMPFYVSRNHPAVPATSEENKLGVVNIQWAPRDPYHGYFSSLYSTQDYSITEIGLPTEYFEKLVNLFAKTNGNKYGQITIGLEGDLQPETYGREYAKQLGIARDLQESAEMAVVTMSEFAEWYKQAFPGLSPDHLIESEDLLEVDAPRTLWYQSPHYRVGARSEGEDFTLFDFRSYHSSLVDPYSISPNKEYRLSINTPSYLDEVSSKDNVWKIENTGEIISADRSENGVLLAFDSGATINFSEKEILFSGIEKLSVPRVIRESYALTVNETEEGAIIVVEDEWLVPEEGLLIKGLTSEAKHLLATRRVMALLALLVILFIVAGFGIRFLKISEKAKMLGLTLLIVPTLFLVARWFNQNSTTYFVSQEEVAALYRLSVLPEGKVVVVNRECLACEYQTEFKPAVFANERSYVTKRAGKRVVYNESVFVAENQQVAREEFEKLNAKYIYVVKYEDYKESPPFSPGDLNIELVYANANAEVWRVKE